MNDKEKMSVFDDYEFNIPPLWEKVEWQKFIDTSEGALKKVVIIEARAANILKKIKDFKKVTPERLAWLSIWTKSFSALESIVVNKPLSVYLEDTISRITLEIQLILNTILDPLFAFYKLKDSNCKITDFDKSESDAIMDVLDRMCAYTAWGLWNDKKYYSEALRKKHLDQIWDPNPVDEIISDPNRKKAYESIFGPLPLETNSGLIIQRKKQEKYFINERDRVTSWLEHPNLKPWVMKIENIGDNCKFWQLFNIENSSMHKIIKDTDIEFAYISYKSGSMTLHGSTIDNFLSISENKKLFPRFLMSDKECDDFIINIGYHFNRTFVLLDAIFPFLQKS